MTECECLTGCSFFNDKMAEVPATADMMKKRYCLGDNTNCARHMIKAALGTAKVPGDLYPAQVEKARIILQSSGIRV